MSLVGKYRWLQTWIGLRLLKSGLRYRGEEDGALSTADLPADVSIVNRIDFILSFCKGKNILHIGFADYPFTKESVINKSLLHLELKRVAGSVIGFDNDINAVSEYVSLTNDKEVITGDLLQLPLSDSLPDNVEVVLLGEVLEHLPFPQKAVDNIYVSFPEGTIILVTVPNYTSLNAVAGSLYRKELVHPDHYYHFSPYTLLKIFSKEKFDLQKLFFGMYYQPGTQINAVLKSNPFMGDCIIAIFAIKKKKG